MGGTEVSEETVKYLVDNINSLKQNFDSVNGVEVTTASINESLDSLYSIWNTFGGVSRINKAKTTIADMDTSRIKEAFQNRLNTTIDYNKEAVLINTVYHQGGNK